MRRRTGRRWLTLAPEPQIDQHRIVIGAAELVGGVQRGLQAGALEVDVVVQRGRLVGVDRPGARAGDVRQQGGGGQHVVEPARLPAEDEGVRTARVALDQVVQAAGGQRDQQTQQQGHPADVPFADAGGMQHCHFTVGVNPAIGD